MAKTKKIVIGDDYQLACDEFLKIAEKTGILTREVIVEPNASERDTLWEITCAIKKRIYKKVWRGGRKSAWYKKVD